MVELLGYSIGTGVALERLQIKMDAMNQAALHALDNEVQFYAAAVALVGNSRVNQELAVRKLHWLAGADTQSLRNA